MVCNWLQIGKFKYCNYASGTSVRHFLLITKHSRLDNNLLLFRSWCGERCQGQGREWHRGDWGGQGARGSGAGVWAGEDELRGPGGRGAGGHGDRWHHGGLQEPGGQPGLQSPQVSAGLTWDVVNTGSIRKLFSLSSIMFLAPTSSVSRNHVLNCVLSLVQCGFFL